MYFVRLKISNEYLNHKNIYSGYQILCAKYYNLNKTLQIYWLFVLLFIIIYYLQFIVQLLL